MTREDEKHWVDLLNVIHESVKGGMKVPSRQLDLNRPQLIKIFSVAVQHRGIADGALTSYDRTNSC